MTEENTIVRNLESGWQQWRHKIFIVAATAFFFLLPWQARYIFREMPLYEWGTLSVYGIEILGWLVIVLAIPFLKKFSIFNFQFSILVLPLLGFLSIIWAPDRLVALQAAVRLLEGMLLYIVVAQTFRSESGRSKDLRYMVWWSFVAGATIQALLGIFQFLAQSTFSFAWLGMAVHDPAALGTAVVEAGGGRWLRAYGSLPHPNVFGGYLAVALVFTLYMISRINMSKRQRYWLLAISYLLLTGIFFSFSRAAWLAAVIILIGLMGLIRHIRPIGLILAGWVAVLSVIYWPLVSARIMPSDTQRLEVRSRVERVQGVREAWQLVRAHPMLGVGIGNYTQSVAREVSPNQPLYSYQPVHSVPLLVWAELGLVGLFFFVIALYIIVRQSKFFILHSSFFILLLLDHYLWSLPLGILLFWAILGLSTPKEQTPS